MNSNEKSVVGALERLSWRFKQGVGFTPNEKDITALNVLIEFADRNLKRSVESDAMCMRLYVYLFTSFLKYYQNNKKLAQKELHRICDRDIDVLLRELMDVVNLLALEKELEMGNVPSGQKWSLEDIKTNLVAMYVESREKFNKG